MTLNTTIVLGGVWNYKEPQKLAGVPILGLISNLFSPFRF